MYLVLEIQTNNGTTAVVPAVAFTDLNRAYQKYYTALAAAAVSTVEVHTVMLFTEKGEMIRVEFFEHPVEPESTEPTE